MLKIIKKLYKELKEKYKKKKIIMKKINSIDSRKNKEKT